MRDNDTVTWVSVTHILKNANDSVDFGPPASRDDDDVAAWWSEIIRTKALDEGFGALLDAIMANGFDPNSPIGWWEDEYGDGYGSITEGHHRLTAAILLGLDEVPTSQWGGGDGSVCSHSCRCNGERGYSVEVDV